MRLVTGILLLLSQWSFAQFTAFRSMDLPFGARGAALGGNIVSLADGDIMQFVQNPAVLDSVGTTDIGLDYSPLFANIHRFSGAYHQDFNKMGGLAFAISYVDYGEFTRTVPNGDVEGSFQAQDMVITLGKAHAIGSFSMGTNLKYATISIDGLGHSMLLGDMGGIYRSPKMDFSAGLVLKNFGFVLSSYSSTQDISVPFDVSLGFSVKPDHFPFRINLAAHNLVDSDRYYREETVVTQARSLRRTDQIMRKLSGGLELVIHPKAQALLGYNFLQRQEFSFNEDTHGAGLSFGFRIQIKNITIRYAHANYHAAGGTDYFTLQSNIKSFKSIW